MPSLLPRLKSPVSRNAGFHGGFDERSGSATARGSLDTPFAARAVMLARAEVMVEMLPEDRQHVIPAPAVEAHLAPVVVIARLAAHVDHGVDGEQPPSTLPRG